MLYVRPRIESFGAAEIVHFIGPVQGYGTGGNSQTETTSVSPSVGVDLSRR